MNTEKISLWNLFTLFLRIGSTAFGGFMALIAVVESNVVERLKWLTHEEMLDGVSLATVLPGPVAVNTVAYVGHRLRGIPGALVCFVAVILPSFLLLVGLSVAYFQWGQLPLVSKLFMGFIPAVTAIILVAAWNMGRKAILGVPEAMIALVAAVLMVWKGGFTISLLIIFGSGMLGWIFFTNKVAAPQAAASAEKKTEKNSRKLLSISAAPIALAIPFWSLNTSLLIKLFITFAGMSVFLFGGGYVFIPLIQHTVVETNGWLTQQEFVDAIAMGQVTPGPIVISAAFIGYKVAGFLGALTATIGIFLPPALLMIAGSHALARIKHSVALKAVLKGIRPAVIGMIIAAVIAVGMTAPVHWVSILIFAAALFVQLKFKLDVIWVIPVAGLMGIIFY
jgi:chromate transporter